MYDVQNSPTVSSINVFLATTMGSTELTELNVLTCLKFKQKR